MSSAVSTKQPLAAKAAPAAAHGDTGFKPWQFFLLAGMLAATATVVVATGQTPANIVTLSLTVISASFVAMGIYRTLVPLVSPDMAEVPQLIHGRTRAALEREKTLVLRSIKELEFDHAMGKVSDADFQEMGERLRARAIGLIQQLDAGGGYRTLIDRELEVRLGRKPAMTASELEAIASTPAAAVEAPVASPYCSSCGGTNEPDARFCKNCGTRLVA